MILIIGGDNIETHKLFKRIGTHNGRFHADEVMATAILKELFEVELIRTRDKKILSELDIVYDVGGGEFDHHDIKKVYREDGIPFAACGLIWYKFGREVIRFKEQELKDEEVESVFNYIDRVLIKGIDALDNGIRAGDGEIPVMNISSIISGFNPPWYIEKNEDEAFNEVVEIVAPILRNTINNRISVLRARDIVRKSYEKRTIPEVVVLEVYCPYGESIQDLDVNNEVLFVVYERKDSFALQTVRGADREDRKKLPESWAGKRDEELAVVTGVKDAVFCHTGRFIAVAESFEGIMEMARLAIAEPMKPRKGILSVFFTRLFSRR